MSSAQPLRIGDLAFSLWIAGGFVLVGANGWLADYWWTNYGRTESFIFLGHEAEHEFGQRLKMLLHVLLFVSFIYGPLGAVLFRGNGWGWGCFAVAFGFGVFALSGLAQVAACL